MTAAAWYDLSASMISHIVGIGGRMARSVPVGAGWVQAL